MLAWRHHPRQAVAFTLGPRITPHLRHEHKYGQSGVEPAHRFHFRTEPDTPTGAIAANLAELEAELVRCDRGVLRHHCPRHDFSGWIAGVFHDKSLAADLAAAEAALRPTAPPRSSNRYAWRSSPRSKPASPAEPRRAPPTDRATHAGQASKSMVTRSDSGMD